MLHFNNIHSSRLNWSIKSMLDNIFLKGSLNRKLRIHPSVCFKSKMIILIQKELNLIWKSLKYQKLKKINQLKVDLQTLIAKSKGYIKKNLT